MKFHRLLLVILAVCISSCTHADQKEIYASDIIKLMHKHKHVEIANKIILDDLDFTKHENLCMLNSNTVQNVIEENVFFYNCVFMGAVKATGTHMKANVHTKFCNNLIFQNCDFRGAVDFSNAVVMGQLNMSQSKFHKSATFDHITVWSKNSYMSEIESDSSFTMIFSSFQGTLYMMDAIFHDFFTMQGASVQGKLLSNGIHCSKVAEYDMLSVQGRSVFNYAKFEKQPTFIQARFHDDVEFIGAEFKESANLENTCFYGKLNMGDKEYPCPREMSTIIKN